MSVRDLAQPKPLAYEPKDGGSCAFKFTDSISFKKVHFRYPMAPKTQADTFQGISF